MHEKILIDMDRDARAWLDELIANGTFESVLDVLDFCVYATKMYSEYNRLTQTTMKEAKAEGPGFSDSSKMMHGLDPMFPIKLETWKKYLTMMRDEGLAANLMDPISREEMQEKLKEADKEIIRDRFEPINDNICDACKHMMRVNEDEFPCSKCPHNVKVQDEMKANRSGTYYPVKKK